MYRVHNLYHKDIVLPRSFELIQDAQDFVQGLPDEDQWVIESDAQTDNLPAAKRNFLVFEGQELPPTHNFHRTTPDTIYTADPIAVRAIDEEAAVKAVMGFTRRISKYAVVEATFIDFTVNIDEPDSRRAELNP